MIYIIPELIFWFHVWRGAFITMLAFYTFRVEHFFMALIPCFLVLFTLDFLYSKIIAKLKYNIRFHELLYTILGVILGIACVFNIIYGFILVILYYIILNFIT